MEAKYRCTKSPGSTLIWRRCRTRYGEGQWCLFAVRLRGEDWCHMSMTHPDFQRLLDCYPGGKPLFGDGEDLSSEDLEERFPEVVLMVMEGAF